MRNSQDRKGYAALHFAAYNPSPKLITVVMAAFTNGFLTMSFIASKTFFATGHEVQKTLSAFNDFNAEVSREMLSRLPI